MRFIASLVMVLALARPADACTKVYVDLFTWFEDSPRVVVARVVGEPKPHAPASAKIEQVLKGDALKTVEVQQNAMCGPTFTKAQRYLGFFEADLTFKELWTWNTATAAALRAWQATKPGKPRLDLLRRLAKSKDRTLAQAANHRLGYELRVMQKSDHAHE